MFIYADGSGLKLFGRQVRGSFSRSLDQIKAIITCHYQRGSGGGIDRSYPSKWWLLMKLLPGQWLSLRWWLLWVYCGFCCEVLLLMGKIRQISESCTKRVTQKHTTHHSKMDVVMVLISAFKPPNWWRCCHRFEIPCQSSCCDSLIFDGW